MELDGRKKPSLLKEVFLTGLTIASLGIFHQTINSQIENQNKRIEEIRQEQQIQNQVIGKIKFNSNKIQKEKIDENPQTQNELIEYYASKFLKYNVEKLDPNLILKRIKKSSSLLSIDENGNKILNIGKINQKLMLDILKYSKQYDVNPKLMITLAIIESKFGEDKKRSSAGAKGPLQIMPENLKYYSKKYKLQNPLIETGFILIKEYAKELKITISYNSDLSEIEIIMLTAAYNAGITNIKNKPEKVFKEANWFLETKNYALTSASAMNHYIFDTNLVDNKGNKIYI